VDSFEAGVHAGAEGIGVMVGLLKQARKNAARFDV
jgi:hypothetical protein